MTSLKHKTNGLIITKIDGTVQSGQDYTTFKWKFFDTIDLIVEAKYTKGVWNYKLYFVKNDCLIDSSEHCFDIVDKKYYLSIKTNTLLQNSATCFGDMHRNSFRLLGEFRVQIDDQQPIVWCSLEKWRKDKQVANDHATIDQTLKNSKDSVSINDLLSITDTKMYS